MNTFEQNIINIYQERGKAWLDGLPQLIKKIATRWNLSDLQPIDALSYHYVLSGFQKKRPIILKLSPENNSLNREVASLKALDGYGVAKILNQTKGAMLLERAIPGCSLKNYFPKRDQEATEIFCKVVRKLHKAPPPQNNQFPHIRDWLSKIDKNWDIPIPYLEKARILKGLLLKTSSSPVLLHGDLHHENILSNNSNWIVIDPHGVIGEPAYETGAFVRNPIPDLLTAPNIINIIQDRINLCANLLSLDKKRITEWCFVQSVLSYIWGLEDNIDPRHFLDLIEIFDEIA